MRIKAPTPDRSELDRVRRRIHREWLLGNSRLPPLLFDASADLHVVGPFTLYLPFARSEGWVRRTENDAFESATVHVPPSGARHRFGERYLVTDRISEAIVAVADFTASPGLVGLANGLQLGTGSVTSALGESLRLLEVELAGTAGHDEAELVFVVDMEHGLTVVLVETPDEARATTLPPAECVPPGVVTLHGYSVELRRKLPVVPRYSFERDDDKRVRGKGASLGRTYATLLERIELDERVLRRLDNDGSIRRQLERFCSDYVLNIDWYDRHVFLQKIWRITWIGILLLVGTLAASAAIWMAWHRLGDDGSPGTAAILGAQLTVLLGGVGGVLKTLASLDDTKARLALFWRARSDLKERLYRFEQRWRGRVVVDGHIAPGFVGDLQDQLEAALYISRDEQLGFFATYKNPTEVFDGVMTTVDKVAASSIRATTPGPRYGPCARPPSASYLAIIQANVDACAARLAQLQAQSAGAEEIARAESALAIARSTLINATTAQVAR